MEAPNTHSTAKGKGLSLTELSWWALAGTAIRLTVSPAGGVFPHVAPRAGGAMTWALLSFLFLRCDLSSEAALTWSLWFL